jgi:hypothetical protein
MFADHRLLGRRPSSIREASIVARQRQCTTNGLLRYSTLRRSLKAFGYAVSVTAASE